MLDLAISLSIVNQQPYQEENFKDILNKVNNKGGSPEGQDAPLPQQQ